MEEGITARPTVVTGPLKWFWEMIKYLKEKMLE